jgi:hypothetical protein
MTTPRFQRTKIKPKSYTDYLQDEVDKGRMDKKEKLDSLTQAKTGAMVFNKKTYKKYT